MRRSDIPRGSALTAPTPVAAPAGRTRAAFALAVCLGVAYAPVVLDMAREWWGNETFSHGFLVPVVAGYLAWRRREAVRAAARPAPVGLALVLLGLLVLAAGRFAEVEFLSHLSLLVTLPGLLLFAWGRAVFRLLAFPYAFLFFLVPWPDTLVEVLSFPMQLLSAKFAAMGVGLMGIPATRDGVDIHLARYSFAVAAPCSGMRSLVALMAMSALAAYLLQGPAVRRLGLFLLGLPLALAANVLRITCILVLAHSFGVAVAEGFFHKFSGLLVFLVACLGLLLIGRALRLGVGPLPSDEPVPPAEVVPARGLSRRSRFASGALALLALALAAGGLVAHPQARAAAADFSPVPMTVGQWRGLDRGGLDRVSAEMLQPDAYLGRIYQRADGYPVDLSVVLGHRKQTFHSPGFCLLGGGWNITRKTRLPLATGIEANEFSLQRGEEERLVVYWYASHGETTPSWVTFQYRLLRNRLLGRPGSGALVRFTAPVAGSTRQTRMMVAALAGDLQPGLQEVVDR